MDIKKLAALAKHQRQADADAYNDGTSPLLDESANTVLNNSANSEDNSAAEEIYVPIEENDIFYDEDFLSEDDNLPKEKNEQETLESLIDRCFEEKAYNIEIDRLFPFSYPIFTDTADISDLQSDIARLGITQPLLVRSVGNGEYEILSGNRRCAAAEGLMWTKVPCRIGGNNALTDEIAKRIVVETNSERYSSLKQSELIRVSAVLGENALRQLHITAQQAQQYMALNLLEQTYLEMLDCGKININSAEILATLSDKTRSLIIAALEQNPEYKLTPANLSDIASEINPTATVITKLLKPKPPVKVAIPAEIISEYFAGKSAEELTEIVTAAIMKYNKGEQDVKTL